MLGTTNIKHVELIGINNIPLLLHLVGCLYYCSSPCSKQTDTCPYNEPDRFILRPPNRILQAILILYYGLHLGLSSGFFPSSSVPEPCTLYLTMHATCAAHLILLDLTIRIIFCQACKSWRSELRNLLSTCSGTPSCYVSPSV